MKQKKQKNFSIARMEMKYAIILILPAIALMAVFQIYPMISGFAMSLTNWDGFSEKAFVGFDNYASALKDTNLRTALLNTLVYTLGTVPATVILALIFATLMNQKIRGVTVFRALYYLPTITSGVAVAMVWKWIFNTDYGLLNTTLYRMGIKTMTPWLNSSDYAMLSVCIMSIWKGLGNNIIIILAGLQSIPNTLYEAAEMDGANGLKRFRYITVPMVSPTLFLVMIMTTIGSFQVFDIVMTMTKGGPGNSTLVAVYYIYRTAFENFKMGYASAMAFILFAIIMLVTVLQWLVKNKWVYSEVE